MRKKLRFEEIEKRLLLTTTIYLDFGLDLGGGSIDTTVGALRDFLNDDATLTAGEQFTGTDMTQEQQNFGLNNSLSRRAIEAGIPSRSFR